MKGSDYEEGMAFIFRNQQRIIDQANFGTERFVVEETFKQLAGTHMTMTTKDFMEVAAIILETNTMANESEIRGKDEIFSHLKQKFADLAASKNPRFNRTMFLLAASPGRSDDH